MMTKLTKVQANCRRELLRHNKLYVGYSSMMMKSFNALVEKGYAKVETEHQYGKNFVTTEKQPQPSFFDATNEDLPLFSQTAPRGKMGNFAPVSKGKQETIKKFNCPACMDTGKLEQKNCWCGGGKIMFCIVGIKFSI